MFCYIYCLLTTAYAETMLSVKQERSTSQFSKGCVLCSRVLPSSAQEFDSSKEALQVRSLCSWNRETARVKNMSENG